jgi:anti-sigma factor RsiW
MSCTVENDLTAYVDGELPAERAATVRSHLKSCVECRATETLLQRTVAAIVDLPEFEPSPNVRRRVLTQVQLRPQPWWRMERWLSPAMWVPSGAGLALAALLAVLVVRHTSEVHRFEMVVASNYELLSDYEVVGLNAEDLEMVEHLDELEGRP